MGQEAMGGTTTKDAAVKGNPLAYIEQNSAKVRSWSKRCMVQGVIDGSGSNGRINGWRKQRLWEQSKEHEWYNRWIKEHNQRSDGWMQAMSQGTIEGTMVQRVIEGAIDQ